MENNSSNAEQLGKIIGAAALEVVSETIGDETPTKQDDQDENQWSNDGNQDNNRSNNDNNQNDDTIHGRGESGLGGEGKDGVPLTKDGTPDGRVTSPNRGGRGRDND